MYAAMVVADKMEFPCIKLEGICPYGVLVESFPIPPDDSPESCPIFGHLCPWIRVKENVRKSAEQLFGSDTFFDPL